MRLASDSGTRRTAIVTSARAATTADDLRRELEVQVYSPVRWIETLQRLDALGCNRFLEVGPGTVLAGMVKRTLPEVQVASFGSLADPFGHVWSLAQHVEDVPPEEMAERSKAAMAEMGAS